MYEEILNTIKTCQIINTHSHHRKDEFFEEFNLDRLLENTYISWSAQTFDNTENSRKSYLDQVRFKSYFVWLQKALQEIYKIKEPLTPQNWDFYSEIINSHHKNKKWHKEILKDFCKYKKIILDAYWNPGSNNGDTYFFSPTFRINPLFFGYSDRAYDHNENTVYKLYKRNFDDIDEYVDFVKELIEGKVKSGCVALKNALAYDRSLDFKKSNKFLAQKAFKSKDKATKTEIINFQNYLFNEICILAAKLNIPLQCHTGLGLLDKTNALNLLSMINSNPETRFVLFHGSFPWTDDLAGLLHACPNVYCDICWLPLLSPTTAEDMLHQAIEIATADKVCWGCDTWTSEESYGAKLAMQSVLANVMAQKIKRGYLNIDDAKIIIKNILYANPKSLYGFDS